MRQRRREQLAQRLLQALREVVDVVGDPAQHVAARLAVDVAQRHPVELVLDVGAQPEHRPLHDAGEQVRLAVRQDRGRRRRARARRAGSGAASAKSMPFPLVTPSTMMLVALPRIFGAITSSVTLATARISTTATPKPSGPQPGREPAGRVLEVLRALERHARPRPSGPPNAAAAHRPRRRLRPARPRRRSASALDGVRRARRRRSAHAASSSVSCDATISA